MIRKTLLLCSLIIGIVLSSVVAPLQPVYSQGSDSLPPPQIIDVWPAEGAELALDEPLSMTFDQPMDRASLDSALSFSPDVQGSLTWVDTQTLEFKPRAGWSRANTYTVTLASTAKAVTGQAFEGPYRFKIKTLSGLQVSDVSPAANASDISPDANIVVSFNHPVVPLGSIEDPIRSPAILTFDPPIIGQGEWINTSIYSFKPVVALELNTKYTVKIAGGLAAVDQSVMEQDYTWTFHTLPPRVVRIEVLPDEDQYYGYRRMPVDLKRVPLNKPIIITFAQSMDRKSTEQAFSFASAAGKMNGQFRWNSEDTQLTFTPLVQLSAETDYVVTLRASAHSAQGGLLSQDAVLKFTTVPYPRVEQVYPTDGAMLTAHWQPVSIIFSAPMDTKSFKTHLQISPISDDMYVYLGNNNRRGLIYFSKDANTTYTITLKAGTQDSYGNQIAADFSFRVTTGALGTRPEPIHANPVINGDLQITNASRPNTAIKVNFTQDEKVKFGLYRLTGQNLSLTPLSNHQIAYGTSYFQDESYDNNLKRCIPPLDVKPENLVRSWITSDTQQGEATVPLASEKGGKLPLGLYWITLGDEVGCLESPDAETVSGYSTQFGLAVVTANMTIKRGTEEVFVWLTRLDDRSPVANATVTVYSHGKTISSGTTGADGVIKLPTRLFEDRSIVITAEKPGEFAAWYNDYSAGWRRSEADSMYYDWGAYYITDPKSAVGYIYTDRPIYRPGDSVKFRGVMRFKRDMNFPVPSDKTVHVKIGAGYSEYGYAGLSGSDTPLLFDGQLALTEYGTFSGEFKVPDENLDSSQYVILASLPSTETTPSNEDYYYWNSPNNTAAVGITVASYRPAEFQVVATAKQKVIFQGDPLEVTLQGLYYFGGPLPDSHMNWRTYASPSSFRYTGQGRYSFGKAGWYGDWYWETGSEEDYYYGYGYGYQIDSGAGTTGSDGSLRITSKTALSTEENSRLGGNPVRLTVEGTVGEDRSNEVSGRTSVIAYPSNLYIGLYAQRYTLNKPLVIDLIAVTAASQPRPNQQLMVKLEGYPWRNWNNFRTISNRSITTGSDGKGLFSFIPDYAGIYRVTVTGADEKGRPNSSTIYVWVPDSKYANQSWADPSQGIKILTDKKTYTPGDTADLLIPVPFPGKSTVLLTIERAGVISHQILQGEGATISYQLPITDNFAPTAYIGAVYLLEADQENPYPHYRASTPISISVTVLKPVLKVSLTPSTKQARPGQTVKFDVMVTDSEGKPAQAEVGLALVDKAVLDLAKPNSGTLLSAFFGPQGRLIYTDVSLDGLIEAVANMERAQPPGLGGGGGGGGGGDLPRDRFDTTPLWLPHLITDKNGQASIEVKLPDNLTTWQLDARAVTLDMQVGQSITEIVSSLPLLIRPVTPRFFVAGDRIELAAVINNNTDQDQRIEAKLVAAGLHLTTDSAQMVTIGAGKRLRVVWPAVVEDAEGADLTFYATGQNGVKDSTKPALRTGPNNTIPIYRYVAPSIGSTSGGTLRSAGSKTEVISLPPRLNTGQGELIVRLDPSLASALTGSFTYLKQFPHYCIEQTTSTFLPNLTTFAALRELGVQDAALEANLRKNLDAALNKIADAQNSDGGWGWFSSMESDLLITSYVTLGLVEAQRAGFDIGPKLNQTNIERALEFIGQHAIQPSLGISDWQLNRQAMVLYMLSRAGKVTHEALEALFNVRSNLAYGSRALLLMAYHEGFPTDPAVNTLISDLVSGARLGSTGAYWQESDLDWYNWNTDIRGTALALTALIRTAPDHSLLPNVVRWLMMARSGDHWSTTQETVWSITGLAEWMVLTKELKGNYNYTVNFNRTSLAKTSISPQNISDVEVLRISVRDLLADNLNRLVVARGEGDGALYYTAQFNMSIPAADAKPISRGIGITRDYFLDTDSPIPVTQAHVGDTITVRLTLDVKEDLRYFVLEDMFPSGTEPINPDLLNTSRNAQKPHISRIGYRDDYWYWGWWYFKHTELTDSQARLYADYLPRGTYIYTYQLKAALPGEYQVIPSYGYTFYFSDIFGRAAGSTFTILPPDGTAG